MDGEKEGRDKDEKDWDIEKDRDKEEKDDKGSCFEFVMPYTVIMPDGSTILMEGEDDNDKVDSLKI